MNLDSNMMSVVIGGLIAFLTTVIGQLFVLWIQHLNNKSSLEQKQIQITHENEMRQAQFEHENQIRQESELIKHLNSELSFKCNTYSQYSFYLAKYCEKKNPLKDEYHSYQREFNNALMASDSPETINALRDLHTFVISKKYIQNEEEFLNKLVIVQNLFIDEIKNHKQQLKNIQSLRNH